MDVKRKNMVLLKCKKKHMEVANMFIIDARWIVKMIYHLSQKTIVVTSHGLFFLSYEILKHIVHGSRR